MAIETRPFGGTGINVSRFCLGAMMFGAMGNRDEAECVRIVHAALDAGINFVDTADAYSAGESERILAKALAGPARQGGARDQVLLPDRPRPERGRRLAALDRARGRGEPAPARDGLDRRLPAPPPRPATDLEESLAAMHTLREQGKIRVVGMSATPADTIVEAQWIAERRGLARVRSEQCIYSIFARGAERAVFRPASATASAC